MSLGDSMTNSMNFYFCQFRNYEVVAGGISLRSCNQICRVVEINKVAKRATTRKHHPPLQLLEIHKPFFKPRSSVRQKPQRNRAKLLAHETTKKDHVMKREMGNFRSGLLKERNRGGVCMPVVLEGVFTDGNKGNTSRCIMIHRKSKMIVERGQGFRSLETPHNS